MRIFCWHLRNNGQTESYLCYPLVITIVRPTDQIEEFYTPNLRYILSVHGLNVRIRHSEPLRSNIFTYAVVCDGQRESFLSRWIRPCSAPISWWPLRSSR